MKQRTFTDSYGRKYMVTVYNDSAVTVLFPGGKTLDFQSDHPGAQVWATLIHFPLTIKEQAMCRCDRCDSEENVIGGQAVEEDGVFYDDLFLCEGCRDDLGKEDCK